MKRLEAEMLIIATCIVLEGRCTADNREEWIEELEIELRFEMGDDFCLECFQALAANIA